jgi:peroxiredoxin
MRKILMPAAALVAIAMAFSLALAADTSKKTGVKPGDTAPSFSLQDQNGKTVSLNDFKGKIVVLEWFNDVCPFVQRHYKAGTMNDLASKWKAKDVVWLAINTTPGTSVSHNKEVVDQWSINHPVLDDSQGTVGREYGAKSTPHMFIIDKDGKIAYAGGIDNDPSGDKGSTRVNYVEKALEDLTSGRPVEIPQTKQYGCGVHYAK